MEFENKRIPCKIDRFKGVRFETILNTGMRGIFIMYGLDDFFLQNLLYCVPLIIFLTRVVW
jgi:hypothetical protein